MARGNAGTERRMVDITNLGEQDVVVVLGPVPRLDYRSQGRDPPM